MYVAVAVILTINQPTNHMSHFYWNTLYVLVRSVVIDQYSSFAVGLGLV